MEKKRVQTKCVYCGKELTKKQWKARVRTRSFGVCDKACQEKTERYVQADRRYKGVLYLLVFIGGLGFALSAFLGGESEVRMLGAYVGQFIAGMAFIVFPYPITSFETFFDTPIQKVTRITRIVGVFLTAAAVILLVLTFIGIR